MKKIVIMVSLILVCILIAMIFSKYVPYNMDEFLHYHPIACLHYENNDKNIFVASCDVVPLRVFGLELPLRAYNYVGSLRSIIYYPIFLIWKSPVSARFLGLIFLLLQSLVLSKIFKIRYYYIFALLLLFFPYFYSHIVDTGPVAFHILSIYLIYYLLTKWKEDEKLLYPLLIGLLSFLSIWEKPIFSIYLIPLFLMFTQVKPSRKMWLQLVTPIIMVGIFSAILFNARTFTDDRYYSEVSSQGGIRSLGTFMESPTLQLITNPYYATHRIYSVNPVSVFSVLYGLFMVSLPFWLGRRDRRYIYFHLFFVITVFTISMLEGSFAIHHIILAFPFLILSVLYSLDLEKTRTRVAIVIFLLMNLIVLFTFSKQDVFPHSDSALVKINNLLDNEKLAEDYNYVILDWGMYYYQSLYGPRNQTVIYNPQIDGFTSIDLMKRKKNIFIYENNAITTKHLLEKGYKIQVCFEDKWVVAIESDRCYY